MAIRNLVMTKGSTPITYNGSLNKTRDHAIKISDGTDISYINLSPNSNDPYVNTNTKILINGITYYPQTKNNFAGLVILSGKSDINQYNDLYIYSPNNPAKYINLYNDSNFTLTASVLISYNDGTSENHAFNQLQPHVATGINLEYKSNLASKYITTINVIYGHETTGYETTSFQQHYIIPPVFIEALPDAANNYTNAIYKNNNNFSVDVRTFSYANPSDTIITKGTVSANTTFAIDTGDIIFFTKVGDATQHSYPIRLPRYNVTPDIVSSLIRFSEDLNAVSLPSYDTAAKFALRTGSGNIMDILPGTTTTSLNALSPKCIYGYRKYTDNSTEFKNNDYNNIVLFKHPCKIKGYNNVCVTVSVENPSGFYGIRETEGLEIFIPNNKTAVRNNGAGIQIFTQYPSTTAMSSMVLQSTVWANSRFDYTLKFSDHRFFVYNGTEKVGTGDTSYSTITANLKFKFDFKLNNDIVYTYEIVLPCDASTGSVPFSTYTVLNDTFANEMFN